MPIEGGYRPGAGEREWCVCVCGLRNEGDGHRGTDLDTAICCGDFLFWEQMEMRPCAEYRVPKQLKGQGITMNN